MAAAIGAAVAGPAVSGLFGTINTALNNANTLQNTQLSSDLQIQRYDIMQSRAESALKAVGLPTYMLYTNNIPTISSFTPGSRGTTTQILGADPRWSFRRGF